MKPEDQAELNIVLRSRERNTVTTASARVQLTVEIEAKSSWSNDTTVAQIDQQALDEVKGLLGRIFKLAKDDNINMRIVGEAAIVNIELKSSKR
jgi:hypothetical protein